MIIRDYETAKDAEAVKQMWIEAGWGEYKEHERLYVESERTIVADVDGITLAMSTSSQGDLQYLDEVLPLSGIGDVITDLTARKLKLGSRITAHRVALDAMDGAVVCGLGAFEDGYYNRIGFGTGSYEHLVHFAPTDLKLDNEPRRPCRLQAADWERMHRNRLQRRRHHGACSFHSPCITQYESAEDGFGFGYTDPAGELTHHLWLEGKGKEEGPFRVAWMAYQTDEQLLELLALIKSFGDQFHQVCISESPNIALQDLLHRPFYQRRITADSALSAKVDADAWWQMRICNIEECLAKTHLPGTNLVFNLRLEDPIETFLDDDLPWRGIAGDYRIVLGPESAAQLGNDPDLPTLEASVGAFTRLWLGAHSAQSLLLGDCLAGPKDLIRQLDWAFRLPNPWIDWEF